MLLNVYSMISQGVLLRNLSHKRPSTWRPCSVCLSLSHVCHGKTDNSLLWQHNYIFTCVVATIAVQVGMCLWACVIFMHVFCLTALNSSLTSRCFQGPLPSHAWWTRDKCQRVNMSTATCLLPQWLHLVCTTCQSRWQHLHMCNHICRHITNEFNPEIHTSTREPWAVLSSFVTYRMPSVLTWL